MLLNFVVLVGAIPKDGKVVS